MFIIHVSGKNGTRAFGPFQTAQEAATFVDNFHVVKAGETGVVMPLLKPDTVTEPRPKSPNRKPPQSCRTSID